MFQPTKMSPVDARPGDARECLELRQLIGGGGDDTLYARGRHMLSQLPQCLRQNSIST